MWSINRLVFAQEREVSRASLFAQAKRPFYRRQIQLRSRMEGAPSSAMALPKPFLAKLYKMVDEADTNAIVSWTKAGDALVVLDPEAFAQRLLPLHFKHNNFSSFVRQLNTYGFSKVGPRPRLIRRLRHAAARAKGVDGEPGRPHASSLGLRLTRTRGSSRTCTSAAEATTS